MIAPQQVGGRAGQGYNDNDGNSPFLASEYHWSALLLRCTCSCDGVMAAIARFKSGTFPYCYFTSHPLRQIYRLTTSLARNLEVGICPLKGCVSMHSPQPRSPLHRHPTSSRMTRYSCPRYPVWYLQRPKRSRWFGFPTYSLGGYNGLPYDWSDKVGTAQ